MKIEIKYTIDEKQLSQTFSAETLDDCARGIYNLLNNNLLNDESTFYKVDDLFHDPFYYKEEGEPCNIKSFVKLLSKGYDLDYISVDGDIILKK